MSACNPLSTGIHTCEKLYRAPPAAATPCPASASSRRADLACDLLIRHRSLSGRRLSTMDAMTLDRWVPSRNEGAAVRCRLFCFPHAGGNAAFYRPLRRFMPPEIDLCPVEWPGRAARLGEPPFTSISALMERLYHALQP